MRKKIISCLMVLSMVITLFATNINTFAASTSLSVQFNNGNTAAQSNTINAKFKVTNSGGSAIDITNIKLRYYYTADSDKAQSFWCDHAALTNGGNYSGVTSNVTNKFVKMSTATSTADTYIEIGFSGGGTLSAGGTLEVQSRVARNDWTNYDQSNDYSYKSIGSYEAWDQVTAYIGSELVYGKEPIPSGEIKDPVISPSTTSFLQGSASDINVTLTPNGNTFKEITGLTKGTNYTVSGNTVTILKSYLNSLTAGSKALTFDFGVTNNPKLSITVNPISGKILVTTIGKGAGNSGDTVKLPISFSNVANVNNVGTCNFYVNYDTSLLEATSVEAGSIITNAGVNFSSSINKDGSISFLFLDNTIGSELIKNDGVFAYINFKIKDTTQQVATPVTFKAGGAFGDGAMSKISNISISDGSIDINMTPYKPSISPTTKSFVEGTASDLQLSVSPNGGTFKGITGLTANTDYSVSGNTVTIFKSYLNSLVPGTKTLTFDFGTGSATLTLTVIKKDTGNLNVAIGTAASISGETVKVPISFSNVANVNNVGTCNFYVTYDTSLLEATAVDAGSIVTNAGVNFSSSINKDGSISFLFLDNTIGSELIKNDGVFAYISFKIKDTVQQVTTPLTFKSGGAFGDASMAKITKLVLLDGSIDINKVKKPSINPTAKSFIQGTASDLDVVLTLNGATFKGITGLTANTDYTVSGTTVTILKNYLNSLAIGTKALTFDFGEAGSATLTLTVNKKDTDNLNVVIGSVEGSSGDTVKVPISFANVANVNNVGTCNFYVTYDTSLLEATAVEAGSIVTNAGVNFSSSINKDGSISLLFLDNTIGSELIKNDGVFANITFKIKDTTQVVTTPLAFKSGGAFGDASMAKITKLILTDGSVGINKIKLPAITPTEKSFTQGLASDLQVELILNGATFNGITGLVANTDYTVVGTTVTIPKNYLNALPEGTKTLTFDFGSKGSASLLLTVKPKSYGLNVTMGTASGKSGDTVTVPISFTNVAKVNNVGTCNFYMTYDTELLEVSSVAAGSIVKNSAVNFSSSINKDGSVSFLFLDNTIGDELITGDGVFANISFKIKDTTKQVTTPLTFKAGGAFGDGTMVKLTSVALNDGYVDINKIIVLDPKISQDSATFVKGTVADDLKIELTPNGNTFNGITGLTKGTDYTENGNIVTISKNYLNNLSAGDTKLTFDFGSTKNPVLTISVTEVSGNLTGTIGSVSCKAGDTIKVPINLSNVSKAGNVGVGNVVLGYNTSILEATAVSAGSIVPNEKNNFFYNINNDGTISIIYIAATDAGLIGTDGEFANVEFKVKSDALPGTTPVEFKSTVFGNSDWTKIKTAIYTNGCVEIKDTNPSINPSTVTFSKAAPENITVLLTYNGNKFNGITGLTKGTDFTLLSNKLILSKDYLATLPTGKAELVFDFNVGTKNPILTLNILDTMPKLPSVSPTTATFDKKAPADVTVTLTYNGNTLKGITGLTKNVDYSLSKNQVIFSQNYLSKLAVGVKDITFDFGVEKNPVLSISIIDSTPKTPTISTAAATFDKNSPADVTVTMTPNGNKFAGISGLQSGVDYTVSENTVVIKSGYMSTLAAGTKNLTFDFGVSNNPVLVLTVLEKAQPATISPYTATFDKYVPTEVAVTLTPNGNTFKGITGLTQGTQYTVSGQQVTFAKTYLSSLAVGQKSFTFDFGMATNPVFTLTVSDSTPIFKGLGVTIGKVSGKAGDIITVPISLVNVSKVGNIGTFNLYINYDTSKLEVQSVSSGSIVKNAPVNFSCSVKNGLVSLLYLDNTIGDELITTDGEVANITFKVIGSSNTALTFKDGGAIGDGNFSKVTDVTYVGGSVN